MVSISDEKPVPSPLGVPPVRATFVTLFQSQMRSQFPRHIQAMWTMPQISGVSISDEKPVPSVSISDEKPVPSPLPADVVDALHRGSFNLR